MGSQGPSYSVPAETAALFHEGILKNPKIGPDLPSEVAICASKIKFIGSDAPSIPINWRFAESISSLKALEGTLLNVLLVRKYGLPPQQITIDTDHAQLFVMSTLLWAVDPEGENLTTSTDAESAKKMAKYFPSWDKHRQSATFHRNSCTNIYKTADNRFFHLHGSMNPDPSLTSIGLPLELDHATVEESWAPFVEKLSHITAAEMQTLATDQYKQAGTICWTASEFQNSEHGKANAHVGLFEVREHADGAPASWWPDSPQTSPARPLAGLKVLDITRVIAAPAIGRGLAEMGASVMRVAAPHLVDFSGLHCDLNWGKWNALLDFRDAADREKLKALILEADVLVQGYRPGVLDKYGLGEGDVLELVRGRGRGIVYVRENCYGWHGPWSGRSGWQQISDAVCDFQFQFQFHSHFHFVFCLFSVDVELASDTADRDSAAVYLCPSATPWATTKPSRPSSPTPTTAPASQASRGS